MWSLLSNEDDIGLILIVNTYVSSGAMAAAHGTIRYDTGEDLPKCNVDHIEYLWARDYILLESSEILFIRVERVQSLSIFIGQDQSIGSLIGGDKIQNLPNENKLREMHNTMQSGCFSLREIVDPELMQVVIEGIQHRGNKVWPISCLLAKEKE